MKTLASVPAYHLTDAISAMTARYGEAERKGAYAWANFLRYHKDEDNEERKRWERAAARRYKAIQRLSIALRDLNH